MAEFGIILRHDGIVNLTGIDNLTEALCAECGCPMRWTVLPLVFTSGDHKNPFALAHADCVLSLEVMIAHLDMMARMKQVQLDTKRPTEAKDNVRKPCLQSPDGNCIKYSWCRPGKEQCR